MSYQTSVLEYLERSAAMSPDKIAFADEKTEITFSQLLGKAKGIGTRLSQLGVRNAPIAVLCDREAAVVPGLLGVLYSGNFYIPIDPQTPENRLREIQRCARPAAVLYTAKTRRRLAGWEDYPAISVDEDGAIDEAKLAEIRAGCLDIDPCYVIFTSGSTGVPKGVAVSHRSVIDFVDWYCDACGIVSEDVLGNQAPFYFDLSVKNLYGGLCRGCTVHILPKKFFSFPVLLMNYIEDKAISVLSWATSAFNLVASSGILPVHAPACIRLVIVGGEALHAAMLNRWRAVLPDCEYINLYGPTEVTVDCTWFKVLRDYRDGEMIPIGRPCRNKEVLLLDEERRLVAPGEKGEICVRGSGVALGYYNNPEKTAEAFIQNPFNPYFPEKLYCTGDIAFQNEDGDLVYLSRKDNQIKHMGYRIELGEVETALSALSGVEAGFCFFDEGQDKIVCICQGVDSADVLAAALAQRLPKYMLPNEYRFFPRIPRTSNGKLDRASIKEAYFRETERS